MNLKKTSILLYIAVLVLAVLACGVPTLPTPAAPMRVLPAPSVAPSLPAVVEMVVIADNLNVRAEADYKSAADPLGLENGQVVKVYLSCTGGEMREWVAINVDCTRWVKASWLSPVVE